MATSPRLSRVSYVGKDFDTFFAEIVQEVQSNFGTDANDVTESNLGTMFIDLVSFGLDTLSFYMDLQANESFMSTAVLDDSVVKIARQLGYKVSGVVSASADVVATLAGPETMDVVWPAGFQFKGGQLIWEVAQKSTLLAGGTSIQFTVREGVTTEERFVSDGSKNQVFKLSQLPTGMSVADGSAIVVVDNEAWEIVEFLEFRADKIVEVQPRTVPPQIVFGDDVAGKIPPQGSEIRVSYLSSSGEAGNDVESGAITTPVTPLVVSGKQIVFTATNALKPTGGSAGPTIDEVRRLAPEMFRAQDAAVTSRDMIALSEAFSDPSYGAVEKASAISIRDASLDVVLDTILTDLQAAIDANEYVAELATLTTIKNVFAGDERTAVLKSVDKIEANVLLQEPDFVTALGYGDIFAALFNDFAREAGFSVNSQLVTINTIANDKLKNAASAAVRQQIGTGTASASESFNGTLVVPSGSRLIPGEVKVYAGGTGPGTGSLKAIDNGIGNIVGTNVSGTVSYFTGAIVVAETLNEFGTGIAVNVDYKTLTTDQADVLSATSQIQSIVSTVQTNLTSLIGSGRTSSDDLMVLLEAMNVHGIDEIKKELDAIRVVMSLLSTAYQADFEAALLAITSGVAAVNADLAVVKNDMFAHVDTILENDCKANVVQVAILTLDTNGFFTGASVGLQQALRTYLNARKESTVTIEVVSGVTFLVGAVISVRIAVSTTLIVEDIRQAVITEIDGFLKGRDFGADLRLSELYDLITAVSGVKYAYVEITGPVANLNADGDLIVDDSYIVTKGSVSVTVIEE